MNYENFMWKSLKIINIVKNTINIYYVCYLNKSDCVLWNIHCNYVQFL